MGAPTPASVELGLVEVHRDDLNELVVFFNPEQGRWPYAVWDSGLRPGGEPRWDELMWMPAVALEAAGVAVAEHRAQREASS